MKHLNVNSMVAAKDHSPWVVLKVGDQASQMEPAKAREVAAWLNECAEAAESDAFIVRFLAEEMDLGDEYAVKVLQAFRQKRGNSERGGYDNAEPID